MQACRGCEIWVGENEAESGGTELGEERSGGGIQELWR